jgi:hypothetical protein
VVDDADTFSYLVDVLIDGLAARLGSHPSA